MQEQKETKCSSEENIDKLFNQLFNWVDTHTLHDIAYANVFGGRDIKYALENKSKDTRQVEEHLKSIIEMDEMMVFSNPTRTQQSKKIHKSETKSGEKHNKGKLPMSKLFVQFPDALQAVVLASCYGHNKYKEVDTNWLNFKRVPGGSQAYKDACLRHSLGAEKDEESELPEIFHQAWNKLAELQLWLEENNINIKKFSKEYLDSLK